MSDASPFQPADHPGDGPAHAAGQAGRTPPGLEVFDHLPDPVYVSDPTTYELLYANPALRRALGPPAGQTCHAYLQGRNTPCPFCTNHLIFGGHLGRSHVWEFRNEANGRWYKCCDRAIPWSDGRMVRFEMAIDIHAQKQAAEALRETARVAKVGGWEIDLAGNTLMWTEETFRIHELDASRMPSVEEALGYYHAEDRVRVATAVRNAIDRQEGFDVEARLITATGAVRWVRAIGNPVAHHGRVTGLRGMIQDLSDRTQAAEALQASENLFRSAFQYSPIGIAFVSPEGRWLRINRRVCEIVGYAEEELLQKTFQDITHPDDLDADLGQVRRMLAGEIDTYQMEKRYFRKDGRVVWILLAVSLVWSPQRTPLHFISQIVDITALKQAEGEKRQGQLIAGSIPVGLHVYHLENPADDRTLRLVYANPATAVLTGLPPEAVVGRTLDENFPGLRAKGIPQCYAAVVRTQTPIAFDDFTYGDDRIMQAAFSIRAFPLPEGQVGIAFENITERKRADMIMAEQEQHLRALFDGIDTGIVVIDPATHVIEQVNPAAACMIGADVGQIVGRHCSSFLCPAGQGYCPVTDRSLSVDMAERTLRRADGGVVPILKSVRRIRSQGREKLIETFIDITARKAMEASLRASEENLRVTFASIGDAVMATDAQGRITRLNPVAERLTGWPQAEAQGHPVAEVFRIVNAHSRQPAEDPVAKVLASGAIVGLANHTLLIARDGVERQIADSAAPIRDGCGATIGVVLVFRDVTGEYALQEQVRQSQKMDAIGQLAGGVAHDFNNMLAGILGGAELLRKRLRDDDPTALRHLDMILGSASRAAGLTGKLLSFARRQPAEMAPLDAHAAVEAAVALLGRSIDRRISVTTALTAGESGVVGDAVQLENVFLNLGINAAHAMPAGGMLSFHSQVVTLDDQARGLAGITSDRMRFLEIAVQDTGCGIAPAHLPRIFEPFFTTKPQGKGTGLGLSAALGTVQQHGGTITVTSSVGAGTCFRVLLPLDSSAVISPPQVQEPPPTAPGGLILVADDEPGLRELASIILGDAGYQVLIAEDGNAALELFRRRHREIALVVLDVIMPGLGGRECLAAMRVIDPAVRIILATGYSGADTMGELRDLGAAGVLPKPYPASELLRLAARVIAGAPADGSSGSRPAQAPRGSK